MRLLVEKNQMFDMKCCLSIIIPAYNAESTISRCLDSVKFQLTDDVEVIIVDDGSSDSTLEICSSYSLTDSRFKVIHKDNGGGSLPHAMPVWIIRVVRGLHSSIPMTSWRMVH